MSKSTDSVLKRSDFLNLVAKSKNKKRRDKLIDLADRSEIDAISECIVNALAGNIPVKKNHISKMKRHKKKLRLISRKKYPVRERKELIKQTGGILTGILPLALSTLGSLVSSLMK